MADSHTIARPYAQAVFDLARASQKLEQWSNALAAAAELAERDDVMAILRDPRLSEAQQLEFVSGLLETFGEAYVLSGLDREGTNFLRLLIENDRFSVMPEIYEQFGALKADIENTVDVTVTAAGEIGADQLEKIRKALAEKLGRRVNISTEIDNKLIGGAVIRAGDFVIDGSVRLRLAKLANALSN